MASRTSLTRERLVVDAVDWTAKVVRTGGPFAPLHDEWALSVRVQCDAPVRGVVFLDHRGIRWRARDWARKAARVAELRVSFAPSDWNGTDQVQLATDAGGIRVQVECAALKLDPVATTRVEVKPGMLGSTGVPMTVLSIPDVRLTLGVLMVLSTDTKGNRTRWRIRDQHAGDLGEFSFLSTGKRSGQSQAST